jgi:hypothetical protein
MTYLDFSLDILQRDFAIKVHDQALFDPLGDLVPSAQLQNHLQAIAGVAIVSEKARSEFIVAPILVECRERMQRRINIFSGVRLDVDAERGLKGECDFILARSESRYAVQAPIMVILEAKKHDMDEGLGQCTAQLLGAYRYNEREGKPVAHLYGCVTTGESWQFLKIAGNNLQIHPERFAIKEVSRILWFLMECLKDVDQLASEAA